jgi:Prenyltransferase and squalene oxidase repeat
MSASAEDVVSWLFQGDVAIQYQTHRDLLEADRPDLRARIVVEGWGKQLLDCRNPDGSWGLEFYRPKWTNSHYTLLDLKCLAIAPDHPLIRKSIDKILSEYKAKDGGIGCSRGDKKSDVCVNGMVLNYACYFGARQEDLRSSVDFILDEHMADGGFNCQSNRKGAHHSSLHSTLSVLEGIHEYAANGYTYRLNELQRAAHQAREVVLLHRFFKSDRTGDIIDRRFLSFPYPPRWYYNILKALDYFQVAGVRYDMRMQDALDVIIDKRGKNGLWSRGNTLPGKVHFVMEPPHSPSRWNTLIALRVLKAYGNMH